MKRSAQTNEADQQAAALEIVRREAVRSGRSIRSVLSLVRVSDPPTPSENLLLGAVRLLRSPHVIMPHPCKDLEEWTQRCAALGLTTAPRDR
jgi:hypothetical protein